MNAQSIPQFYTNKSIFITGSTGFLGKVVLEKLLRSCPGIKKIFLVIRSQKGKCPNDRFNEITDAPLFGTLKDSNCDAFKKVIIMEGNVSKLNLGLSQLDYDTLINEIDIIFHVAASVRFDDSLPDAVIMNTRGSLQVLNLALKIKQLQILPEVVSKMYCETTNTFTVFKGGARCVIRNPCVSNECPITILVPSYSSCRSVPRFINTVENIFAGSIGNR